MTSDPVAGSPTVAGHPGISWSIALDAVLGSALDRREAQARLDAAWPGDGRAGPVPRIDVVDGTAGGFDAVLGDLADRPYAAGEPPCRVVMEAGPPSRMAVAGHHAVLDGLGLVAVLGAALGTPLGTTARGAGAPPAPTAGQRLRSVVYPVGRLGEALLRPPARIAPDRDRPGQSPASRDGDHLVSATVAGHIGTAELVAACAGAVAEWNARRGRRRGRVSVAVGASRRRGANPEIGREAIWFRVDVDPVMSADDVRRLLAARGPEPDQPRAALRAARAAGIAKLLERRTGSTLLVSNLGGLVPEEPVVRAAFYPAAHGRSGVAVGAIRAGQVTTITARARRSDFTRPAAAGFLDLVAGRVGGPSSASPPAP